MGEHGLCDSSLPAAALPHCHTGDGFVCPPAVGSSTALAVPQQPPGLLPAMCCAGCQALQLATALGHVWDLGGGLW